MLELIKGLAQVRDGLTLIAFLSLVLLLAFRTRKVPELLFGLFRDKLTRQQFATLLHRFMVLGFSAFIALVLLAALSQVLGHITAPRAMTVDDLRRELAKAAATEQQKDHVEAQYDLALEKLSRHDFDGAIASLKASVQAIPTLAAQEMLVYLYRQKGDFDNAAGAWEAAKNTARENGDLLAQVRLDNDVVPRTIPSPKSETDLVGTTTPLPKGGALVETAVPIESGLFRCVSNRQNWWYKVNLTTGQRLSLRLRTADDNNGAAADIAICDTNGAILQKIGNWCCLPANTIYKSDWTAAVTGWHFIRLTVSDGTVLHLEIL
ncbi:MAG TPA: hypothetical protein VMB34_03245 [Acetobacteraceae bacterium]|nr:hypothetical protein [Acetobacteraceae bacterium]